MSAGSGGRAAVVFRVGSFPQQRLRAEAGRAERAGRDGGAFRASAGELCLWVLVSVCEVLSLALGRPSATAVLPVRQNDWDKR